MKKFNKLIVEYVSRTQRTLKRQFLYDDSKYGLIAIPPGFTTDLASIEPLRYIPLLFSVLSGYGDKASVVHDWLYHTKPVIDPWSHSKLTRGQADGVFYRALRAEGVARWRASIFYIGVRLFAKKAWKK